MNLRNPISKTQSKNINDILDVETYSDPRKFLKSEGYYLIKLIKNYNANKKNQFCELNLELYCTTLLYFILKFNNKMVTELLKFAELDDRYLKAILDFKFDPHNAQKEKDLGITRDSGFIAIAVQKEQLELTKQLLDLLGNSNLTEKEKYINAKDGTLNPPLRHAIYKKNHQIAERLLESNANINCMIGFGNSPLVIAAHINDLKMVKLLIKYHANPFLVGPDHRKILSDGFKNKTIRSLIEDYAKTWPEYYILKRLNEKRIKTICRSQEVFELFQKDNENNQYYKMYSILDDCLASETQRFFSNR